MGKIITKEQFELRLKQTHPYSNIEIIEFSGIAKKFVFKCLKCGKQEQLSSAGDAYSRLNLCSCHKDFNSRKEKILFFESQQKTLKVLEIGRTKSKVQCLNCNEIFERTTVSLMASFDSCPYCNNRYIKQRNTKEESEKILSEKYGDLYIIKEYKGYHDICKIYCKNCHHIYVGTFESFLQSRGCPKCKRNKSRGEQKIERFLIDSHISFISQQSLNQEPSTKRYKFDFYIPDKKIAIEYNGEQHYIEKKNFFDGLKITQQRDNIKKEYCKRHNIELIIIPYTEYNKIEEILKSRFNDYPEREYTQVSGNR